MIRLRSSPVAPQSAEIFAHPLMCHTPQDMAQIEEQTGRKAVFCRYGVKLVDVRVIDDYELADRQSHLSTLGAFEGDAA